MLFQDRFCTCREMEGHGLAKPLQSMGNGAMEERTSQVPGPMGFLLYLLPNQEAPSSREGRGLCISPAVPSLIFISLEAGCRNKEIKETRLQLAQGLRSFLKQLQGQSQSLRHPELAALCVCRRAPWWRNTDYPSYWQSDIWDKLAQYYNLELKVSVALAQVTAPELLTPHRLNFIYQSPSHHLLTLSEKCWKCVPSLACSYLGARDKTLSWSVELRAAGKGQSSQWAERWLLLLQKRGRWGAVEELVGGGWKAESSIL